MKEQAFEAGDVVVGRWELVLPGCARYCRADQWSLQKRRAVPGKRGGVFLTRNTSLIQKQSRLLKGMEFQSVGELSRTVFIR